MPDDLKTSVAVALLDVYPESAHFVRTALMYGIAPNAIRELLTLKYSRSPETLNNLLQIVDYLAKGHAHGDR